MSGKPVKPGPNVDAESAPFWQAAKEHRLILPYCTACTRYHFYPRCLCPHCHSDAVEWREAAGTGTIYSYTVARRGAGPAFKDDAPYAIALIELSEGPRMMSNIVTDELSRIAIGAAVRVQFDDVSEEITMPKFALA